MKNIILLLALILIPLSVMGQWFPTADSNKSIPNNIDWNKHTQKIISGHTTDPQSASVTGGAGSFLLKTDGSLYVKKDSGNTTNWKKLLDESTSSLGPLDFIDFNTAISPAALNGRLHWDQNDKTLSVDIDAANSVKLQVGQEQYIRAVAGENILDGQVVYVCGAQGNRPKVCLAKAIAGIAEKTVSVATQNCNQNNECMFTTSGIVGGYNTSLFADGDRLYLSNTSSGTLTKTMPTTPNLSVPVAWALNSTNNGKILIDIRNTIGTDVALTAISDEYAPSEKAVKTYVDTQVSSASNQWTASGTDVYRPSGNVGIGTSTPRGELEIFSDEGVTGIPHLVFGGDTSEGAGIVRNNTGDGGFLYLWGGSSATNGSGLYLNGNNLADGGSLQFTLGQASSNYDFFDSTISNLRMRIQENGNVGIGTAYGSPITKKLDVEGDVLLNGSITTTITANQIVTSDSSNVLQGSGVYSYELAALKNQLTNAVTYKIIHAEVYGSDTDCTNLVTTACGDGTVLRPYKSIVHALTKVVAPYDQDHHYVIRLGSGRYIETADIVLPPYTDIIGEGHRATYVRVSGGTNSVRPSADWATASSWTTLKGIYFGSTTAINFDLQSIGGSNSNIVLQDLWSNVAVTIKGRNAGAGDFVEAYDTFFGLAGGTVTLDQALAQWQGGVFAGPLVVNASLAAVTGNFINCTFGASVTLDGSAFPITSMQFTNSPYSGVTNTLTTLGTVGLYVDNQSLPKKAYQALSVGTTTTFVNDAQSVAFTPAITASWSVATKTVSDALDELKAASGGTAGKNLVAVSPVVITQDTTTATFTFSIPSCGVGQHVAFDGTTYICVDASVSAGQASNYFFIDIPSGVSTYEVLSKTASTTTEELDSIPLTVNNTEVLYNGYANGAIGTTSIDAGLWEFNMYRAVTAGGTGGTSQLVFRVFKRTTGGVETELFNVSSGDINDTAITLQTIRTTQPAFPCNADDILIVKIYGITTAQPKTISFTHNGTARNSFISSPLAVRHNQLSGLQGGISNEYYHTTANQNAVLATMSASGTEIRTTANFQLDADSFTYYGDPLTNGTFRMRQTGSVLIWEKRVLGSWTEVYRIE